LAARLCIETTEATCSLYQYDIYFEASWSSRALQINLSSLCLWLRCKKTLGRIPKLLGIIQIYTLIVVGRNQRPGLKNQFISGVLPVIEIMGCHHKTNLIVVGDSSSSRTGRVKGVAAEQVSSTKKSPHCVINATTGGGISKPSLLVATGAQVRRPASKPIELVMNVERRPLPRPCSAMITYSKKIDQMLERRSKADSALSEAIIQGGQHRVHKLKRQNRQPIRKWTDMPKTMSKSKSSTSSS
jgi:hypothetical protein